MASQTVGDRIPAGLLSPELSRRASRPVHCWSPNQQQRLQRAMADLFSVWHQRWALAPMPQLEVSVHTQAVLGLHDDEAKAALPGVLGLVDTLGSTTKKASPLVHEVMERAWADWLYCVNPTTLRAQDHETQHDVSSHLLGTLWVEFPWGRNQSWVVSMNRQQVQKVLDALPSEALPTGAEPVATLSMASQVPLNQALGSAQLEVAVHLSAAQLNLGQLSQLHVGDVITLAHALDQPAHVVFPANSPTSEMLCKAWLGQSCGLRAIELMRSA